MNTNAMNHISKNMATKLSFYLMNSVELKIPIKNNPVKICCIFATLRMKFVRIVTF